MILELFINDLHSFKGLHKIEFAASDSFTAVVGPNGAGKSTILSAIGYLLGATHLSGLNEGSYVEAQLQCGIKVKRGSAGSCWINGTECSVDDYLLYVHEKCPALDSSLSTHWREVLDNPTELLVFIESLSTLSSEGFSPRLPHNPQEYAESWQKVEEYASVVTEAKARLRKISNWLQNLKKARSAQQDIIVARGTQHRCLVRLEASKIVLARLQAHAAKSKATKLELRLEQLRAALTSENDEGAEVEERWKATRTQYDQIEQSRHNLKAHLDKLFEDQIEVMQQAAILNALASQPSMSFRGLLAEIQQYVTSKTAGIDRDIPNSDGLTMVPLATLEGSSTDNTDTKTQLIDKLPQLNDLCREVDAKILSTIERHNELQHRLASVATQQLRTQAEMAAVEQESTDAQLRLGTCKIHTQTYEANVRLRENSSSTGTAPENISDISHLRLVYPEVQALAEERIRILGNEVYSVQQATQVFSAVQLASGSLYLVVNSESSAVTCARRVCSSSAKSLVFLPQFSPDSTLPQTAIPTSLVERIPGLCWLRDLLTAKSAQENHLVDQLARQFLVVPNLDGFKVMQEQWPNTFPVCDVSGLVLRDECGVTINVAGVSDEAEYHKLLEDDSANLFSRVQALVQQKFALQSSVDETLLCFWSLRGDLAGTEATLKFYSQIREEILVLIEKTRSLCDFSKASHGYFPKNCHLLNTKLPDHSSSVIDQYSFKRSNERNDSLGSADEREYSAQMKNTFRQRQVAAYEMGTRLGDLQSSIQAAFTEYLDKVSLETALKKEVDSLKDQMTDLTSKRHDLMKVISGLELRIAELTHAAQFYEDKQLRLEESVASASQDMVTDVQREVAKESDVFLTVYEDNSLARMDRRLRSHTQQLKAQILEVEKIISQATSTHELDAQYSVTLDLAEAAQAEVSRSRQLHLSHLARAKELRSQKHHRVLSLITAIKERFAALFGACNPTIGSASAQSHLGLVNPDNVDEGVSFYAVPAGKPYAKLSDLSGGEFALVLAALHLSIAITLNIRVLIIDEIDAELDRVTCRSLAHCVNTAKEELGGDCDIYFATHQRVCFNSAKQLVGVFKNYSSSALFVAAQ